MDISPKRRTVVPDEDGGEPLVLIHAPVTVGQMEAWTTLHDSTPAETAERIAWFREERVLGAAIIRETVRGVRGGTVNGQPIGFDDALAAILDDWRLTRHIAGHLVSTAVLDAAVGKD